MSETPRSGISFPADVKASFKVDDLRKIQIGLTRAGFAPRCRNPLLHRRATGTWHSDTENGEVDYFAGMVPDMLGVSVVMGSFLAQFNFYAGVVGTSRIVTMNLDVLLPVVVGVQKRVPGHRRS